MGRESRKWTLTETVGAAAANVMQTEGLYRLSGSKAAIDDIKRAFDANGACGDWAGRTAGRGSE